MSERHRITFLLGRTALAVALAGTLVSGAIGCGGSKKELNAARHSLYDLDFAAVFSAALDATRSLYPNLDDAPGSGTIKTAWHQVQYANNQDDLANQRTLAQGQGVMGGAGTSPAMAAAGMPTRLAYKRYFIRFDVTVAGGRPWRLKIVGHASEWEPGNALPTELHGPARPHWLDGRTDALLLAIHRKLKTHAVPMKEEVDDKPEHNLPKTDPKAFVGLPPAAAQRLAKIRDAVVLRDYGALRAQLADDVVWSLGGAPGADTAMAMWQADPESLDALVRVMSACTAAEDGKRVTCPGGDPKPGAWQLVLEPRGKDWKLTSFVKAE